MCSIDGIFVVPSEPYKPGAFENEFGSLLVHVHENIFSDKTSYVVVDILGSGGNSDVYRVSENITRKTYSLKIYKHKENNSNFDTEANNEIRVLSDLKQFRDAAELQHIGLMVDSFEYKNHIIIVNENYPFSLYQAFIQRGAGFGLPIVQQIAREIASALHTLHKSNIIHCDVKPENILITKEGHFKLIDFGSARRDTDYMYLYIQTRYYRAPEVILEFAYTNKIDIWSYGCLLAESFLGFVLFPGASALKCLQIINKRLNGFPDEILEEMQNRGSDYLDDTGNIKTTDAPLMADNDNLDNLVYMWIKSEYETKEGLEFDKHCRDLFLDLLHHCLEIDPKKRFNIDDVLAHPFLHECMEK